MFFETLHLQVPYQKLGLSGEGCQPRLVTYFAENSPEMDPQRRRPCVLICPGGGYQFLSDREAEPVALAFAAHGFHTAVLYYSVAPACFPTGLLELAAAMVLLRTRAEEWHLDPNRLIPLGFSAGGHLVGSLGVFWNRPELAEALEVSAACLRPNGMILSYPVITSGEFAHKDSFQNLLGSHIAQMDKVSLEKQVGPDTPPAFLWHTFADDAVPVENTLLMANAMRRAGRPFELHIFPEGGHGLSLATEETKNFRGEGVKNECACWVGLAADWIKRGNATEQ